MPASDAFAPAAGRDDVADLALLRSAAGEAAALAMRYFRKSPKVWTKNAASPVSEADIAVDTLLKQRLLEARPDYGWLSEETEDDLSRMKKTALFVVDPIDGTRAFVNGERTWCISVAVVIGGRPVAGVLDCPATGEVFEAAAGNGAFLNGKPIRVSAPAGGFHLAGPKPIIEKAAPHLPGPVRRHDPVPSLAYRIAMVAAGRIDGTYVKPDARDWDLAAADIILSEAGGALWRPVAKPPLYGRRETAHASLIAGAGHALKPMLKAIS